MAIFLGKVGIERLPLLFLTNAVFVVLGTVLIKPFLKKTRLEVLISFTVLLAAVFLMSTLLFYAQQNTIFFLLFLVSESLLLSQVGILISLFNEDLFSPLESQRTFPIIESAETLGGIIGGLTLSLFAESIPLYKFILVLILILLCILPIVLKFNTRTMDVPTLGELESPQIHHQKVSFASLRKIPFLKGLMIIVALHWAMMNIVEFQYTKAVEQEVMGQHEETLVENETGHDPTLASIGDDPEANLSGKNIEQDIAVTLGNLHLIFNSAALLMQLILTSRILGFLGITSTMLLHPLVTFMNLILMSLRFNFYTASLTRGSFELTGILFKNSYDSSYYGIPHEMRVETKELMQGIMKPLGAILGTITMILIAWKLEALYETLALNSVLIILSIAAIFITSRLGRKYTLLAEQNLSHKKELPTRLNAVEILAQKGHEEHASMMGKLLQRVNEPDILKEKIIEALGLQHEPESISSLLEELKSPSEVLRFSAARALKEFHDLSHSDLSHSFSRIRVIETLKERLELEENDSIREEIMQVYYQISSESFTEFLMSQIEKTSPSPTFVRMLRLFPDPNLKYYLTPLLTKKNPELRAAAILSLWQFNDLEKELRHHLNQMLTSTKNDILIPAINIIRRLKLYEYKRNLHEFSFKAKPDIKNACLAALAQMEEKSVIPDLVDAMLDPSHAWYQNNKDLLTDLSDSYKKDIEQELILVATERIHELLRKHKNRLSKAENETLKFLKDLYSKINAHHEAHRIQKLLDSRDS